MLAQGRICLNNVKWLLKRWISTLNSLYTYTFWPRFETQPKHTATDNDFTIFIKYTGTN